MAGIVIGASALMQSCTLQGTQRFTPLGVRVGHEFGLGTGAMEMHEDRKHLRNKINSPHVSYVYEDRETGYTHQIQNDYKNLETPAANITYNQYNSYDTTSSCYGQPDIVVLPPPVISHCRY